MQMKREAAQIEISSVEEINKMWFDMSVLR